MGKPRTTFETGSFNQGVSVSPSALNPESTLASSKVVRGKGTLYVVATPIGNLQDLSQRAIMTLEMVDLILAEYTRTTRYMIRQFGDLHKIDGQVLRLDDH